MSALVFLGSLLSLIALGLPIAFALMFAGVALMLLTGPIYLACLAAF